jgi:hypothetical protein
MANLTINWDGKDYTVPEAQSFELIEAIEQHITLPELMMMIGTGKPNFSALARPFHAMLVQAGVRNAPSLLDLRRMLVAEGMANARTQAVGGEQITGSAMRAIAAMIEILMDGAPDMGGADAEKKTEPRSPKPATKSRSGSGASRRKTSGK